MVVSKKRSSPKFSVRMGQDHFFKTKTAFLKTIKLLTQDLKKCSLTEKTRAGYFFSPPPPLEKTLFPVECRYYVTMALLLHPQIEQVA